MSHKTNSWEEEDVKRGKKLQKEGHLGHARALFDDAHGSYNYNGHNSTGAEHNHAAKNTGAIYEEFHNERKKLGTKPGITHPAKMHGSMEGDQSDQHIDYKNYKGTDKGYHGSTGSSHGDQSNIFHDYDKHPAKNMGNIFKGYNHPLKMNDYGDPAAKGNAFIGAKVAAEKAGKSSFNVGGKEHPVQMSEDLSNPVLSDDMNLTGQGYAKDEGGNTSIMPALRNLYGMKK